MYTMEMRQNRLPIMPPNYVSFNDLKERYLKEQEEKKQREIEEANRQKSAAAVVLEMPVENIAAVDCRITEEEVRERRGKAVVVEGEDGRRRERGYEEEICLRGGLHVEEGGYRRRREKVAVEEGGYRRRRENVGVERESTEAGGYRERRGKAESRRRERASSEEKVKGKAEETLVDEAEKVQSEETEEGGYRVRRGKAESRRRGRASSEEKAEETLGEEAEKVRSEEGDYRKRREKYKGKKKINYNKNSNSNNKETDNVEETLGEEAEKVRSEGTEGGDDGKRRGKYKGKKKIKKNYDNISKNNKVTDNVEETLDEKTEEEKVLAALGGGDGERETVVVNGRVWMKKITWVEVDPTEEIEQGFKDFSLRDRNDRDFRRENRTDEFKLKSSDVSGSVAEKGGDDMKDVLDDRRGENGRRIGNNRKKGKGKGFRKYMGGEGTVENTPKVEDLSVVVERDNKKNVLGDRRAENGWGGDLTAEIGVKIGDFATSEKKKGESSDVKENVVGGRIGETGRRFGEWRIGDKKRGNGGRNGVKGGIGHFRGLDSSLVWVRKEEKSEVCVAGNCSEGVLAKAGESEKRPGRGRP